MIDEMWKPSEKKEEGQWEEVLHFLNLRYIYDTHTYVYITHNIAGDSNKPMSNYRSFPPPWR